MSETGETSSKSLKAEDLREALEAVIAKKGRHYSNLATFSLRFSADNTQAIRDSQKFIDFATSIDIETKHDLNERVCIQPDELAWPYLCPKALHPFGKYRKIYRADVTTLSLRRPWKHQPL